MSRLGAGLSGRAVNLHSECSRDVQACMQQVRLLLWPPAGPTAFAPPTAHSPAAFRRSVSAAARRGFLHFFFFFFPSWIMGNLEAKVTMILAFFTGPVLTQLLAAQYMDTYKVGRHMPGPNAPTVRTGLPERETPLKSVLHT